jgi:hypothetical protein
MVRQLDPAWLLALRGRHSELQCSSTSQTVTLPLFATTADRTTSTCSGRLPRIAIHTQAGSRSRLGEAFERRTGQQAPA